MRPARRACRASYRTMTATSPICCASAQHCLIRMTDDPRPTDMRANPPPLAHQVCISYSKRVRSAYLEGGAVAQDHSTPLPPALARIPLRTIRPRDATAVYPHPRAQLARLAERGLLHRLADGYYAVVPQDMVGHKWMPGLEAAAAG